MSMQMKWLVALVVILGALGLAYWSYQGGLSQSKQTVVETTPLLKSPIPAQAEVKTFEVEGKPFEFSVKEIRVKEGDKVSITFKNTQGMHDWVVDEFSTRTKQIQVGENETVEFVASKKGTFEYYCSVGNGYHRQQGMVGKLIVE